MFTIIVLAILGLLAVAAIVASIKSTKPAPKEPNFRGVTPKPDPNPKTAFAAIAVILAIFFIVIATLQSVKIVGANEVGVPVTFGHISKPLQSGFHVVAPWTEVETLPTRPQTIAVTAHIRTSESGQADVIISGRWATNRDQAAELFRQVRTGDDEKIQTDIVGPQLQGAANQFYGGLLNTQAINGKEWATNAAGVSGLATLRLARYGIQLVDVQIREVKPDKATNDAIARIAAQQRETQVANESKATADAQAAQRLAEANGIKAAADRVADLAPGQIRILCLQSAERIMNKNQEKGIPTYALPCQDGTSVLAK